MRLICAFFSKALPLQCYQCLPDESGTCTDTQTSCTDQCASKTHFINYGQQPCEAHLLACAFSTRQNYHKYVTGSRVEFDIGCTSVYVNHMATFTVPQMPESYLDLASPHQLERENLVPAPALQCYQCIPDTSGACTDTPISCTDQCASATTFMSAGGQEQQFSGKYCATAAQCITGSLNLGLWKETINTKCCSTDLCNSQTLPALPFGAPNGKKCFTCVNNDCTRTVNCAGDEDQCISTKVTFAGAQATVKGCASRSVCAASASSLQAVGITGSVSCCEGDLCNRDPGEKLSLLIMLFQTTFVGGSAKPLRSHSPFRSDLYLSQLFNHNLNLSDPSTMRLQVTLALICMLFPRCECLRRSVNVAFMLFAELSCLTLAPSAGTAVLSVYTRYIWNMYNHHNILYRSVCQCDRLHERRQTLPALPFGSPNGRRCYTCVDNDCRNILNCEGTEDRCITIHVQCYQCIPDESGTCTTTQTFCPDQCASATTSVSAGGYQQQVSIKGCAAAPECISGSMNLGLSKTTINTKCCSTKLCNSQTLPALSRDPNGRRCYTCVGNDCTNTLNCEGIEDRCITVNENRGHSSGLGMAGDVVMRLCDDIKHKSHKVFFDNFFCSIPLIEALKDMQSKQSERSKSETQE
ncbi:hypothetical protein NFI96_020803 [Prochilodus magdalenae]|nr:hypothetical protein NFI96_020803 [Prochilodus magdalenae]